MVLESVHYHCLVFHTDGFWLRLITSCLASAVTALPPWPPNSVPTSITQHCFLTLVDIKELPWKNTNLPFPCHLPCLSHGRLTLRFAWLFIGLLFFRHLGKSLPPPPDLAPSFGKVLAVFLKDPSERSLWNRVMSDVNITVNILTFLFPTRLWDAQVQLSFPFPNAWYTHRHKIDV